MESIKLLFLLKKYYKYFLNIVYVLLQKEMMEKEMDSIDKSIVIIDEKKEKKTLEKYANYYFLLDFWLKSMEQGKKISSFFENRKYKSISIYGMASLGEHLKKQLEEDILVLYSIDRNVITYNGKDYGLQEDIEKLPRPDVIVVTPVMEYKEIKENLEKVVDTDIISLEEVVLSL